jgi:DNA primase
MDNVEEIKQKLDIADVIKEYIQLNKAGVNYKACCPFHNEKTPSFYVTPEKGIFHCFGCNEGGDMFTFIQKMEGVEFPEALRLLAKKAGVPLKNFDPRVTSIKNKLLDACEVTTVLWQSNLELSDIAKGYVEGRGLTQETIKEFKLGYAPDSWDTTMNHLRSEKFNETEIFQAGLTVQKDKDKGTGYYDRFRDRIIFPIQDVHGNVIGFTGRTLKKEENAKYINTPESPIYHKGRVLYGLDKAKRAIRDAGYVVIVEGNMDVISAHQAGYKNVVACSGTALTGDQIRLLKRYTSNVALCFDTDDAGQNAAKRSVDLLFAEEMNIKIVEVINGKDPDECIMNSVKDWEQSLKQAKLVMQFYFDKILTPDKLSNISLKKTATKELLTEINKIKDKIEQDHWIKKLAEVLQVNESLLWESLPSGRKSGPTRPQKKQVDEPQLKVKSRERQYFERIMTILFNYPELIGYAVEYVPGEVFEEEELVAFYKTFILYYTKHKDLTKQTLNEWLETENQILTQGYLNSLLLYVDQEYQGFDVDQLKIELIGLVKTLKINYSQGRLKVLSQELAQAEKDGDQGGVKQCLTQIHELSSQLDKLK